MHKPDMSRRHLDENVLLGLDQRGLILDETLPHARRGPVVTAAPAQGTKESVNPKVKGNIALVAVIAPILLILIGAGIWWWVKYRRQGKRYVLRSATFAETY